MNALQQLDKLITSLDRAAEAQAGVGDAIDAILAGPPRTTATRSLRNDEVIRRFRQEVADGMIRVDTMGKLLEIISTVVSAVLAAGA